MLPLAEEGTPILENAVRPFARIAQPFTARPRRRPPRDLAKAGPDLTDALRELNRLFNIGAYNPGGSEGIARSCENAGACTPTERNRNEGYLYWLGWVGQNTVSLFSTARRARAVPARVPRWT